MRAYAENFVAEHGDAIEEVVKSFGGLSAKQLELRATIVYVVREAKELGISAKTENTAKMVHDLKPHFQISEIKDAINQLNEREYVTVH